MERSVAAGRPHAFLEEGFDERTIANALGQEHGPLHERLMVDDVFALLTEAAVVSIVYPMVASIRPMTCSTRSGQEISLRAEGAGRACWPLSRATSLSRAATKSSCVSATVA